MFFLMEKKKKGDNIRTFSLKEEESERAMGSGAANAKNTFLVCIRLILKPSKSLQKKQLISSLFLLPPDRVKLWVGGTTPFFKKKYSGAEKKIFFFDSLALMLYNFNLFFYFYKKEQCTR